MRLWGCGFEDICDLRILYYSSNRPKVSQRGWYSAISVEKKKKGKKKNPLDMWVSVQTENPSIVMAF